MKIDYGCGEKDAILSVHTMMLYEQEFRSDIIQDLFGKAVLRQSDDDDDVIFSVDYRNTNWTASVRVLWAALKTADDGVPPFSEWEKSQDAIDLNAIANAIIPEAWRMFFRAGASDSE